MFRGDRCSGQCSALELPCRWFEEKCGLFPITAESQNCLANPPEATYLTPEDDQFLEDLERANCLFFVEQASPQTGLVSDRCNVRKPTAGAVASIAATGFGLTALCIAHQRGFLTLAEASARTLATLRFLWRKVPVHRGFFYHFADINTGERTWNSEVSSIDTAILLCGILMCRQHFAQSEIRELAHKIFNRVDWSWLSEDTSLLPHGWTPEFGFLPYRWDYYSELMAMYLLGLGSYSHPSSRYLVSMEARYFRIRRSALHWIVRAAVRSPILAGLV